MTLEKHSDLILLVDDDEAERMLFRYAVEDYMPRLRIDVAEDGQRALDYLRDCGPLYPRLLVLDINMPRIDGISLLSKLQGDDVFQQLDSIVMSTAPSVEQQEKCSALGASAVFTKPFELEDFESLVREICAGWFPESRGVDD